MPIDVPVPVSGRIRVLRKFCIIKRIVGFRMYTFSKFIEINYRAMAQLTKSGGNARPDTSIRLTFINTFSKLSVQYSLYLKFY